MADAAYAVLSKNSRDYTGNFAIDEEVLRAEGVRDFKKYAVNPGKKALIIFERKPFFTHSDAPLTADFFIPDIENYPETFLQKPERKKSIDSLKQVGGRS